MSIKFVLLSSALVVMPFVRVAADNCIISGSTNRTFSARVLSAAWAQFDTGPNATALSPSWNGLDSRLYTFDITSGHNLLRERTCFVLSFR